MSSIAGNTSTTAELLIGEIESNTITAAGDADWFKVTLVAGRSYSFTLASSGGPGIGLPDPDMTIYDSLGNPLTSQNNYTDQVITLSFRATTSGTYYIGVGDGGTDIGNYALSWVATDNIVNTTATTATLVANGTKTSKIDVSGDSDWFGLNMTSGLSYGFEVKSNGVGGLPDADIILRDSFGNAISGGANYTDSINLLTHNATQTGKYYLDVNDSGLDTGGYAVRWIATDTILNNIATTQTLASGAELTSAIDVRGDQDWVKVTLVAGKSYAFEVTATGLNGLPDGDLTLRDAGGNIITSSVEYNYSKNTLSFTAATSGTYFISVGDTGTDSGGYLLRNVGVDAIVANQATTSTLLDGGRIAGLIDNAGDMDWHMFSAHQGQAYEFTLSGDGSATELASTRLVLRDAAGNVVYTASGDTSTINYTATADGPLYLDVQGYNANYAGRYLLSVVSNSSNLTGTDAADRLQGDAGATTMSGLNGNDWLAGGAGADRIYGGNHNDTLSGNADNDQLYGGAGNDSILGGSGVDQLDGGAGNDILRGGLGADQFLFRPAGNLDTIVDFQDGIDTIRIIGGPSSLAGLTLTQVADDVEITFGTTTIHVNAIDLASLSSNDFLFA